MWMVDTRRMVVVAQARRAACWNWWRGRPVDRWTRAGAGAGLAGAVVYVVGAFMGGTPLKPDDPIDKVVNHLSDHRSALLGGVVLTLVGLALFLWFLGYLRALLAGVEGDGAPLATTTVAAWVALFVLVGAGGIPLDVVVWRGADQVDPTLVRLAFDAAEPFALCRHRYRGAVVGPGAVRRDRPYKGPPAMAARAWGCRDRVLNLVEIAGLFSRNGWNTAGYAYGLGPILWVIWVAAVSIAMMLRKPVAPQASGTAARTPLDVSP